MKLYPFVLLLMLVLMTVFSEQLHRKDGCKTGRKYLKLSLPLTRRLLFPAPLCYFYAILYNKGKIGGVPMQKCSLCGGRVVNGRCEDCGLPIPPEHSYTLRGESAHYHRVNGEDVLHRVRPAGNRPRWKATTTRNALPMYIERHRPPQCTAPRGA